MTQVRWLLADKPSASGVWNRRPAAGALGEYVPNLCVPRHSFGVAGLGIFPERMLYAFPPKHASVLAKVAQQALQLHPTTTSSCLASGGSARRDSSRR